MFEINSQNKDNYVHIGTKGGATKISSGYAFSFFLKQLTSKDKIITLIGINGWIKYL